MRNTLLVAFLAASAMAVDNYQKCLRCFHEHRVDHFFCEPQAECYDNASWDCAEEDKIKNYWECPQSIDNSRCGNYTFTRDDFEREEEVVGTFSLNEGVGCWMQIDREQDGSYGVAAIDYDNPYLLVFDDFDLNYEPREPLGLVEESTWMGWGPRTFFVANSGLMPTQFSVIWDGAQAGVALAASGAVLLAMQLQ